MKMLTSRILFTGIRSRIAILCKSNFIIVPRQSIKSCGASNLLQRQQFCPNVFYKCSIHTTPKRYNPIVSTVVRQVIKILTMFTARTIRNWYRNLPEDKQKMVLAWLARQKWKFFTTFLLITISVVYYYQSHIQESPITQRKRFIAFTPEQFRLLNKIELEMKLQQFSDKLLSNNHPATRRVARVAKQLVSKNHDIPQIKEHEWTVSVIDDLKVMNAFVLPSGNIFVFSGLLRFCENDHQLGIVLAHEMSHAILQHGVELASHAHIIDLLFIGLLGFVWMFFPTDFIAAIGSTVSRFIMNITMETPYSRMLETEADEVGLELAAKACFDVREASVFWKKMATMEKTNMTEMFGTPEPPINLDFMSTHPSHEERSTNLEKLINVALICRQNSGCPPLPRMDPRDRLKQIPSMKDLIKKELQGVFRIEDFRDL